MRVEPYERQEVTQAINPAQQRAPQTALGALGEGVGEAGQAFFEFQDEIDTAAAKEADAALTSRINEMLYGQNGYMYAQGGNAVSARENLTKSLDGLYEEVTSGLAPGARRVGESAMRARLEGARTNINQHAMTQGRQYINQASEARVGAAIDSAIFNPAETAQSLHIARQEITDMAAREGWAPEVTAQKLAEAQDKVHAGVVARVATADPVAAMDYLARNRDQISGPTLARLEAELVPVAKAYRGRQAGAQAFTGGNVEEAMRLASTTLGMNEVQQRDALTQYMRDGGQNLDPAVTAWCAAFVNATLAKAGFQGTGSLMARSFLDWGQPVASPQRGDIVVLDRGNPPYGHVGFFDGYNDDGTIRILGGNQGDAVSMEGYDPKSVLGFRRAPAGGTGIESLLAIEDPTEREAAFEEYSLRSKIAEGQQKAQVAAAQQGAYEHVLQGGRIADLDLETQRLLGREELNGLRALEGNLASGTVMETRDADFVEMMDLATNPRRKQEFLATSPLTWAGKLDRTDFERFVQMQTEARSGSVTAPNVSSVLSTADPALRAAGIVKTENPDEYARFQSTITRWATANPDLAANPVELDKKINSLLVPVVLNRPGMFNEQSGAAFQIDWNGKPLDPTDDVTVDDVLDGSLKVNGETVPREVLEQFATEFVRTYRRDPTPQEMVEAIIDSGAYD
jgi:uncharacterized protein (TIGR02594 family)